MTEKKSNKITYKVYPNIHLKRKVDFHGEETYPLYVQVTYERKPISFKSYYFDLLSKPRYLLKIPGVGTKGPSLADCIKKEKEVIEYIINKHKDDFSHELFKSAYQYLCNDLCDVFQDGFVDYLHRFFWDEGRPALGDVALFGSKDVIAYDLVRDFRKALKPELISKLEENALYYAPPYLQIYGFMEQWHRWPTAMLTVMELDSPEKLMAFKQYLLKRHPDEVAAMLLEQVGNWPKYLAAPSSKTHPIFPPN